MAADVLAEHTREAKKPLRLQFELPRIVLKFQNAVRRLIQMQKETKLNHRGLLDIKIKPRKNVDKLQGKVTGTTVVGQFDKQENKQSFLHLIKDALKEKRVEEGDQIY